MNSFNNTPITIKLNEYINDIRNNYDLTCISEFGIRKDDKNSENENIPTYEEINPKIPCEEVIEEITNAGISINTAFLFLFNNLTIENGDHQNFLIINGMSESFRTIQRYDVNTDKFVDELAYTYICGNLYGGYERGVTANFLSSFYTHINTIKTVCEYYQQLYENFEYNENECESGTSGAECIKVPKWAQFWKIYYTEFYKKIVAVKRHFTLLKTDFNTLYNYINQYISLGKTATELQSACYNFMQAEKRTEENYGSMKEIFNNCEGKFKYYDTYIENIYTIWKNADADSNKLIDKKTFNSGTLGTHEKNMFKHKYIISNVLETINFFNVSKNLNNNVLTFFKKYNI